MGERTPTPNIAFFTSVYTRAQTEAGTAYFVRFVLFSLSFPKVLVRLSSV